MYRYALSLLLLVPIGNSTFAGTGYEITSTDGEETVSYMVKFGGGMMFNQYTAYDPASKKFVYLTWENSRGSNTGRVRGSSETQGEPAVPPKAPKPVCSIWDHHTGKTTDLYQFAGVKHPLPIIPSLKEMKVCPITGDRKFKAKAVLAFD
jgi:hypothetical protein